MPVKVIRENWPGKVNTTSLGIGSRAIKIGGEEALPFLSFEGEIPYRPVVAGEVWDEKPGDWPDLLTAPFAGVLDEPAAWAKKCLVYGADLICLRLVGAHPGAKNKSPQECARIAQRVYAAINTPLIVVGCGEDEKDAAVLPAVAEALAGKNCLLGWATAENYRLITTACNNYGHSLIASSPLDISLAKQLNILITEMGFNPGSITIDPLVGALGYGLEYAYSIMERIRLSALTGDKMLAIPVICFVGQETWKTKEATISDFECPSWGEQARRAILWELLTAVALTQAGGAIMVLRHPETVRRFLAHLREVRQGQLELRK
ncbi:MAG TPA: acetyl-CoA decarbonylase/synthase complex subunit delta [Desulfotomaculum sp.]|nr:acetyl-CoA decarbonylase/synthase complex subunit delta [Desulfotomaculum sp.]